MINTLPKSKRGRLAYYIDEIERLRHEGFTYNEIFARIKDELELPAMSTQAFRMGVRKATENIQSGAYVVEQRKLTTCAPAAAIQERKSVAEMVQSVKEGKKDVDAGTAIRVEKRKLESSNEINLNWQ